MTPSTKYTVIWRTREININRVYEVAHPSDMERINCRYTPFLYPPPLPVGFHSLFLSDSLLISFALQNNVNFCRQTVLFSSYMRFVVLSPKCTNNNNNNISRTQTHTEGCEWEESALTLHVAIFHCNDQTEYNDVDGGWLIRSSFFLEG